MRVIAALPHPECKITIFSMNQKFIIKLEKGVFEQVYKISEMDVTEGVNGVFKILDDQFMKNASDRFLEMRSDFNEAYQRNEA